MQCLFLFLWKTAAYYRGLRSKKSMELLAEVQCKSHQSNDYVYKCKEHYRLALAVSAPKLLHLELGQM